MTIPGPHRGSMFDLFHAHGLDEARIEGMKSFSGAYRRLITELPHIHLNYLMHAGSVERRHGPDGVLRFATN